jgi:predicted esterase
MGNYSCCNSKKSELKKIENSTKIVQLDGDTKYEIYSPTKIIEGEKSPLFFFLAPGGNPEIFRESVIPVCEKNNSYYAGSYNYRNNLAHTIFIKHIIKSVKDIISKNNIDRKRVYLCGFSGGGTASYVTSYFYPVIFTGVIANCGVIHQNIESTQEMRKTRLKKIAIIAGENDRVVPYNHLKNNGKLIKKSRIKLFFRKFNGAHEVAKSEDYEAVINWMLKK